MASELLQLTEITKSFGAVRALTGVSFGLKPGEVHALLGENGAGKSTLIKVITGAHQPDSGNIYVNGALVEGLTPAMARGLGIAAIYQQPALFPDLSVAENIALGLENPSACRLIRWEQRHRQATELLKRTGANIRPETEVRDLSMPEQQLVEIARALGTGARVLVMDEPTASLTAKEVQLLLSLIDELRSQGVGIIYITHRLEEVFGISDRVTVLRDGKTVGTRIIKSNTCTNTQSKALESNITEVTSAPYASKLTESELIHMMVGREISSIFPASTSVPGEVVLELQNICCAGLGLHDINLSLRKGEILGLAGLVGAGRTELARVIFGICPAEHGSIKINGNLLHIRSPQDAIDAGIGYVPEDRRRHGVIPEMSVAANMSMAIHPRVFPHRWLRQDVETKQAEYLIETLAIKTPGPAAPVANLSGGNQQKVALARWLAAEPRVLILDEPTQGVDVGAKAEIHKIIRSLAQTGIGVLMISSDLPEILGMSDRIAVMRDGRIVDTFEGKAEAHSVMAAALGQ